MAECMEVSTIVSNVLKNFSSTELLEFSLVNKLWMYEARSVARKRGNLTAIKNSSFSYRGRRDSELGWLSCQDLRDLVSDVHKMNVIPFRGILIRLGGGEESVCDYRDGCSPEELDLLYRNICDRVHYKKLSIRFSRDWQSHSNCPVLGLVKKILNNPCSGLEELSLLLEYEHRDELFAQQVLQDCNFERLKTFKLLNHKYHHHHHDEDHTDLVKILVSRAPNLQVLYTESRLNLDRNLLEGSSATHLTSYDYCAIRQIPDSVVDGLRLKKIKLRPFNWEFSLDRFNRITPILLQNSRTLLSTVEINVIFLLPLMRYMTCLENVQELKVYLFWRILESCPEQLLTVMKSLDFTRNFPRLVQVAVFHVREPYHQIDQQINGMVDLWDGPLDEPKVDRAVNIKSLKLILKDEPFHYNHFGFLAEMLPDIEKIIVTAGHSILVQNIPLAPICHFWVSLKDMEVNMFGGSGMEAELNLDHLFCGIHPEEVALLREQDENYLREVHIVSAPSIRHLNDLKTLSLRYREPHSFTGPLDDPTYLFSKVTDLIAFKRCPDLSIDVALVNRRIGRDLRHLEPYVSNVSYR